MNCKSPQLPNETNSEYHKRRDRDRRREKAAASGKVYVPRTVVQYVSCGDVFGKLTALEPSDKSTQRILCKCECGKEKRITTRCLVVGYTKSCGCSKMAAIAAALTTHGISQTPMHRRWNQMIMRCHNPKHKSYAKYGEMGISVCERWRTSVVAFIEDMGYPPTPQHTLDRWPDPAGNYEKDNCRWATPSEQSTNWRTRNHWITAGGVTLCLTHWAEKTGIRRAKIKREIARGIPSEVVLGIQNEII